MEADTASKDAKRLQQEYRLRLQEAEEARSQASEAAAQADRLHEGGLRHDAAVAAQNATR